MQPVKKFLKDKTQEATDAPSPVALLGRIHSHIITGETGKWHPVGHPGRWENELWGSEKSPLEDLPVRECCWDLDRI